MSEGLLRLKNLTWSELGKRVYNEIGEDDVLGSAAQLAYYFLFALFPLLIFLTSIFGFVVGANNELRNELFGYLGAVLPGSASTLVNSVIGEVTEASSGGKLTLGLFLALWAASSGLQAITQSINQAYGVKEERPWWKLRLIALGLTVALALLIISALILVLFGNHIIDAVAASYGFGSIFSTVWRIVQYLLVLAFVLLAFALIYYWSPNIKDQSWSWITPGAIIGVGLWLLISFGFRIYLSYFDSYSATYGSLGAVIVLMLWLYFTGIAILIGAEINSEIENAAAEAGVPEAKEKGEKASGEKNARAASETTAKETGTTSEDQGNQATPQTQVVHREQQQRAASRAVGQAYTDAPSRPARGNIVSRIFTVASMVAGVFGYRKNENS